jgi:hypothetical protein
MKFVFLCKQDCNNPATIKIVKEYVIKEEGDAVNDIENTLLSYICDELGEGKKQLSIVSELLKTDKSVEDIKNDDDLPFNHYIKIEDGVYYLYEKYKKEEEVVVSGWISNTVAKVVTPCIRKVCMFTTITHNLEIYDYVSRCACNDTDRNSTTISIESHGTLSFVDQMRSIFAKMNTDNSFDNTSTVKISELNFGDSGVTKYNASSFKKNITI